MAFQNGHAEQLVCKSMMVACNNLNRSLCHGIVRHMNMCWSFVADDAVEPAPDTCSAVDCLVA